MPHNNISITLSSDLEPVSTKSNPKRSARIIPPNPNTRVIPPNSKKKRIIPPNRNTSRSTKSKINRPPPRAIVPSVPNSMPLAAGRPRRAAVKANLVTRSIPVIHSNRIVIPSVGTAEIEKRRANRCQLARKEQELTDNLGEVFSTCRRMLKDVMANEKSWPFYHPVGNLVAGYTDIIKHPMDLTQIDRKLLNREYDDPEEFKSDVQLCWDNAKKFNNRASEIHQSALFLEAKFNKLYEQLYDTEGEKRINKMKERVNDLHNKLLLRKQKLEEHELEFQLLQEKESMLPPLRTKSKLNNSIMTYEEKCTLYKLFQDLPSEYYPGIAKILESENSALLKTPDINLDVDELGSASLRKIESYVIDSFKIYKPEVLETLDDEPKSLVVEEPTALGTIINGGIEPMEEEQSTTSTTSTTSSTDSSSSSEISSSESTDSSEEEE
eukprot:TRINITY_DN2273_c0_g1_i2.p1 TRINITY_DN2273_c0_g1~~TRINITY_DN2273_c0_g1_i2.p1  ORF type:complete len:439 (-),score=112.50 TRINITY_DN2273_c0_g1_i2:78-1394(-)